jgi:hypothetical protein
MFDVYVFFRDGATIREVSTFAVLKLTTYFVVYFQGTLECANSQQKLQA